jgi:hypothetical protein
VTVVAILALLHGASPATATGLDLSLFYAFAEGPAKTGAAGGTATFTSKWKNVTGIESAFIMPLIANGTTKKQAADQTALSLLANRRFRPDWEFEVVEPNLGFGAALAQGTSLPGRKAEGLSNRVRVEGIENLSISAGIDPEIGVATFDVFSDGLPLSEGVVRLGIAGQEATTSTTRPDGSPKDFAQIKADLLQGLRNDGFGAFLDPGTGLITVPHVSTGDPEGSGGTDVGASFLTTADGVGGLAGVAVPFPEPGALPLLGVGLFCLAARGWGHRRQTV